MQFLLFKINQCGLSVESIEFTLTIDFTCSFKLLLDFVYRYLSLFKSFKSLWLLLPNNYQLIFN